MANTNKASHFIEALNQVVEDKGIDANLIFEAIESSLVFACKKNYGQNYDFKITMDRTTGKIECRTQKQVVETVEDDHAQISLENAKKINPAYKIGDTIEQVIMPKDFGRISAKTAKDVIVQKLKEAERDIVYNKYIQKEKEIVTGIVQRIERKNVIVSIDKIEAVMPPSEQMQGESYPFLSRIKVYITEVKKTGKGPLVHVSRTHPALVLGLFEQEVPEIYDKIVEIKNISREAGQRTKISVFSNNPNIDAVGACVGPGGSRVGVVVNELRGEKIDIINWSSDPKIFIESALNPSKVIGVSIKEQTRTAQVIVPKEQLSLAIGRDGQNARLAAKLTGFRIDIKSQDEQDEEDYSNVHQEENDPQEYDEYSYEEESEVYSDDESYYYEQEVQKEEK